MKNIIKWAVLLLAVLFISAGGVYWYLDGASFQEIKSPVAQNIEEIPSPPKPEKPVEEQFEAKILPKFEEMYKQNNDLVGWINVPNTMIDYPILQAEDNDYYLHRNFEKKKVFEGIPFMDFRNVLGPELHDNTLIYGHNMGVKGTIFTELMRYQNIDFYKKSPVINVDTLYDEGQWKVIAAYEANTEPQFGEVFEYYNFVVAETQEDLDWYLDEIKKRSFYTTDVDVELGDKLVTLQTCVNDKYETKLVVVARRVREGESAAVDVEKAVTNPNRLLPRAK